MHTETWQKSSYCAEGSNCVELRAGADGSVALRESAEPDAVLTADTARVGAMLRAIRAGACPTP